MKKIKIAITITVIMIVIIIIALIILTKSKPEKNEVIIDNNQKENINEINPTPASGVNTYIPEKDIYEITSELDYFNIKSIVEKYFYECNNLKNANVLIPRTGLSEEELKKYIATEKEELKSIAQKVLYNIFGDEYIKEFNITENNIINKFGIDYSYKIILNEVKKSDQDSSISAYIVNGDILNIQKNSNTEFELMICMDAANQTYSIYPTEYLKKHEIYNLKAGNKLSLKISEIKENNFNKYEIQDFSDELVCKEYFSVLRNRILYNPDSLYNKLNSEYSKKRFENIEKFRNYINENKNFFLSSKFIGYKIVELGTQKEYICIDQYNNYYIFKRTGGLLDYSILLDDYTIMEGSEVISYSKLDESSKAQYNLMKFIKMINHKDYDAIYNILNKEFRNNNFKSTNNLKTYITNNFYEIVNIKLEKMEEKEDYYVFRCKISNYNNTKESKNINIIIGKTNNTNFEMSFSFE